MHPGISIATEPIHPPSSPLDPLKIREATRTASYHNEGMMNTGPLATLLRWLSLYTDIYADLEFVSFERNAFLLNEIALLMLAHGVNFDSTAPEI